MEAFQEESKYYPQPSGPRQNERRTKLIFTPPENNRFSIESASSNASLDSLVRRLEAIQKSRGTNSSKDGGGEQSIPLNPHSDRNYSSVQNIAGGAKGHMAGSNEVLRMGSWILFEKDGEYEYFHVHSEAKQKSIPEIGLTKLQKQILQSLETNVFASARKLAESNSQNKNEALLHSFDHLAKINSIILEVQDSGQQTSDLAEDIDDAVIHAGLPSALWAT